jgi:alanyl-tRNA synthetase
MKNSKEIRNEFIDFFKRKNHTFVPSSSVIPKNDPSLLFTNAGMNQFKDVFLDSGSRPYRRAVNSQKCIRVSGKHNDLEEVGQDTYHHTFFEMLGNWSFGDYYKKEAIAWAWELFTEIWSLPKNILWATIYKDDDEAIDFWRTQTDINPSQILRFGDADNFWEMGETGPCGPSSEIHVDLGESTCDKKQQKNHICKVNGGCSRYIELWNLVFIQYNRDSEGVLHPLPKKHVDTGMGFERIVAVLQNVRSNYETDLFTPLLEAIENIAKINYTTSDESVKSIFRVLADHVRMLTFAITDGAIPSNEGRGYVLRRILRRGARYARKINLERPFIFELVPVVVEIMGRAFPEIQLKQPYVMEVIKSEEENFNKTLDRGIEIFENLAQKVISKGGNTISGKHAFQLYDTYGFPLDLTRIMAIEKNLIIDEDVFDREMELQRERARKAGKFVSQFDHIDNWKVLRHCPTSSHFVGYDKLEIETEICKFAEKDGKFQLVLTETPFYAESGGQVADKGEIIINDFMLDVINVQKEGNDIIHFCQGSKEVNIIHSKVIARVDKNHRYPTMYNHTSTHLLHEALRRVLGEHVEQAGSLVSPEKLRFDFKHFKKIDKKELTEIENIVNAQIRNDWGLEITYTDFKTAQDTGAIALFGEKYGEEVRMISIDNFSKELCGGTHVKHTGEIGSFIILQEMSIASGTHRIEAITGPKAIEFVQKSRDVLFDVEKLLNTNLENLPQKIQILMENFRDREKQLQKLQAQQLKYKIEDIINNSEMVGNVALSIQKFENIDVELLKEAADKYREKAKSGIILLVNQSDDKLNFVCAITDDLIQKGYHAGNLVKEVARLTSGGGGGRSHMATAGGKNSNKLEEALIKFKSIIQSK